MSCGSYRLKHSKAHDRLEGVWRVFLRTLVAEH